MKKILSILACFTLVFTLAACSSSSDTDKSKSNGTAQKEEQPTDLTGTWVSEANDGSYQEAVISDGTIEINWVNDEEKTKSLYWSGTYEAPTKAVDEFNWTSKGDTEKMSSALMASQDETKDFSYKDGVLSYEASALGTTKTVEMTKK